MDNNFLVNKIFAGESIDEAKENANKNGALITTRRDYVAGLMSKYILANALPDDINLAEKEGWLHFHDRDYSAMRGEINCSVPRFETLLSGCVINGTKIVEPNSIGVAATVLTQLILVLAGGQYGGLSVNNFATLLAPYVYKTRDKEIKEFGNTDLAEKHVKKAVKDAIQTFNYQLQSFSASGQIPFISVLLNAPRNDTEAMIIEEVLRQRLAGMPNEHGTPVTQLFPKLIYVLDDGINLDIDDPYYYLTHLAAKCSSMRMYPDYISSKKMREIYGGVYTPMGCRSFPTYDRDKEQMKARFNKGVQTINIKYFADKAKNVEQFYTLFDEGLKTLRKAGEWRVYNMTGTLSDSSPLHWQYGGLATLKPGEVIDELLLDGNSTISLGYIGLAEAVMKLTGINQYLDKANQTLADEIMTHIKNTADKWNEQGLTYGRYKGRSIGWSVYGTPAESLAGSFAEKTRTKRGYLTNSFHVPVWENCLAFNKQEAEGKLAEHSPGGNITYVEVPDLTRNTDAIISLLKWGYDHCPYFEINNRCSDVCDKCGYTGQLEIKNMHWECPKCHNKDENYLTVVRRVCGYLGSFKRTNINDAKLKEATERVLHL